MGMYVQYYKLISESCTSGCNDKSYRNHAVIAWSLWRRGNLARISITSEIVYVRSDALIASQSLF
jgi:hypothetical protein